MVVCGWCLCDFCGLRLVVGLLRIVAAFGGCCSIVFDPSIRLRLVLLICFGFGWLGVAFEFWWW